MRTILLTAIVLSLFAILFEGFIVFRNLKNKLHAYLFLNCISMFINNTGYLLQLLSKTEDAYIAALKFSYAGRVWIVFSLFMFTIELCHVSIPKPVTRVFILINTVVYVLVFTLQEHMLYYSKIWFDKSGMFPVLLHRNGIVHKVFMQYQTIIICYILFLLFRTIKNHKGKIAKKRSLIIVGGFVTAAALYITQIAHIFFITYYFDISVFGNVAITVSMFIAIFRYNLLGIIDMAREYIVDRLSEGVIAIDPDGRVQYYNEHAKELYPEIEIKPESVKVNVPAEENFEQKHEKNLLILGVLFILGIAIFLMVHAKNKMAENLGEKLDIDLSDPEKREKNNSKNQKVKRNKKNNKIIR